MSLFFVTPNVRPGQVWLRHDEPMLTLRYHLNGWVVLDLLQQEVWVTTMLGAPLNHESYTWKRFV